MWNLQHGMGRLGWLADLVWADAAVIFWTSRHGRAQSSSRASERSRLGKESRAVAALAWLERGGMFVRIASSVHSGGFRFLIFFLMLRVAIPLLAPPSQNLPRRRRGSLTRARRRNRQAERNAVIDVAA
ncbi:hypothetical protein LZ30DRAFT_735987 [Colletotrichum cereale]|nr:hypothetical protein LZ30DRAFT_735987 [Colletotrichum cereale]